MELENKVLGRDSRPRITDPRLPVEDFKSTPLIEIPDTPQRPKYYIAEDFEEEMSKLSTLHIELNVQYEDKLRKALMYLAEKIEWPLFYDQLARVVNIWEELKTNEEVLKLITNKWGKKKRRKEVTFLCFPVIMSSHDQIEKIYDIATELPDFDEKRIHLQKIIISYLTKYKSKKFYLFPHAIDRKNRLTSRDEWAKQLNDLFYLRINKIINEKGHAWWATSTGEMVNVQLFFDSLKQDFVAIYNEAEYVLKRKRDILHFNWPDDIVFDTWMADLFSNE